MVCVWAYYICMQNSIVFFFSHPFYILFPSWPRFVSICMCRYWFRFFFFSLVIERDLAVSSIRETNNKSEAIIQLLLPIDYTGWLLMLIELKAKHMDFENLNSKRNSIPFEGQCMKKETSRSHRWNTNQLESELKTSSIAAPARDSLVEERMKCGNEKLEQWK